MLFSFLLVFFFFKQRDLHVSVQRKLNVFAGAFKARLRDWLSKQDGKRPIRAL